MILFSIGSLVTIALPLFNITEKLISAKIGKTEFYNDSKATNPESSIVAINSFNDKDVVVAGSSTRLEVWSKEEWDKKTAAVLDIPDEDLETVLAESGVRI